jgi:hypothetical protein
MAKAKKDKPTTAKSDQAPKADKTPAMGRGINILFGEGGERPRAIRATPAKPSRPREVVSSRATLYDQLSEEARAGDSPETRSLPQVSTADPRRRQPLRSVAKPTELQRTPAVPSAPAGRLRVGGVLMDIPSDELASLVPPGPGETITPEIEIKPRDYSREEQARILSDETLQKRLLELMVEVDELYKTATTRLAVHPKHSGTALKLLHEARAILIERPYAIADAELRLQAARTLINRTEESRKISRRNWPWLFAYEIFWSLLLLTGLVFEGVIGVWVSGLGVPGVSTMPELFPAWGSMMAGGIGGVICALWSLWYHMSDQQDYDSQHNLWYLAQPLQGMVLGIVVYFVFAAGFLAVNTDITSADAGKAAKYIPWVISAVAGIRQTLIYEMLDRIIGAISPKSKS